ncbi:MAG: hypothetical protein ACPHK8_06740 [Thermoplasmatota archaeon]
MVSKTILAVMLVGAFGLLPVSAMTALDTGLEPVDKVEDRILAEADPVVDPAMDAVSRVQSAVDEVLSCQVLVKVPVIIFYGDIVDERTTNDQLRVQRVVTEVKEVVDVPILKTSTVTVWAPTGVLGFLEPVTKQVTEIVGYDQEEIVENHVVNVAVDLSWTERYVEWSEPHPVDVYLPMAAGAAFLTEGSVETVCDDVTVSQTMPHFGRNGHDYVHWHIGREMDSHEDGWHLRHYKVDTRLAEIEDLDRPMRACLLCPTVLWNDATIAVDDAIEGFVPTKDTAVPRSGETAPVQEAEPHTGSQVVLPASTMAFLAIVASALVAAGLIAYNRLRK